MYFSIPLSTTPILIKEKEYQTSSIGLTRQTSELHTDYTNTVDSLQNIRATYLSTVLHIPTTIYLTTPMLTKERERPNNKRVYPKE